MGFNKKAYDEWSFSESLIILRMHTIFSIQAGYNYDNGVYDSIGL